MTPQEKQINSDKLYSLIDRLQKYSEWKYGRKWSSKFYDDVAFNWSDKVHKLENKIIELEKEMDEAKKNQKLDFLANQAQDLNLGY